MPGFYKIYQIILIVLLSQQRFTKADITNRIVGGRLTTIDRAKYLVSVRNSSGGLICGGSLVKDRYVVTAAHCLIDVRADEIFVHGGATYLNEEGIKRAVERIITPAVFTIYNLLKDVAVLKLKEPMRGKNIATIPLCTRKLTSMTWVQIYGWGSLTDLNNISSNQLRMINVRMFGHKKCVEKYTYVLDITRTMMCASGPGDRDSCYGDSGGPLHYRGELCGVVSFGIGCGRKQFPGVYTSINAVKNFIRKAMEK